MFGARVKRLKAATSAALLLSVLIHGALLYSLYQYKSSDKEEAFNRVSVRSRVLSVEELDSLIESSKSVVKNDAQKTEASPKKKYYLSEQTAAVDEESVKREGLNSSASSQSTAERSKIANEIKKQMRFGIESSLHTLPIQENSKNTGILQSEDQGSSADLLKSDVAHGVQTLLNTLEFKYASFYNRLKEEIAPRWKPEIDYITRRMWKDISDGLYITELEIEADKSGKLLGVYVVKSSGVDSFDEAAVNSFWDLGSLTNLPRDLIKEDFYKTNFTFVVQLTKKGIRFDTESELDRMNNQRQRTQGQRSR